MSLSITVNIKDIGVQGISFVPSITIQDKAKFMTINDYSNIKDFSDAELVQLFQSNNSNHQIYKVIVERYQEKVRNTIFSYFRDVDLCNDIAQDVFIKIYKALPRYRFDAQFATWVYRITINACKDELRKQKARRFFSFQRLDNDVDNKINLLLSVEQKNTDNEEVLALGLQKIPEKFRTPLILRDVENLPYEEIAKITKTELGTVKSRISRAREMLRKAVLPLLQ